MLCKELCSFDWHDRLKINEWGEFFTLSLFIASHPGGSRNTPSRYWCRPDGLLGSYTDFILPLLICQLTAVLSIRFDVGGYLPEQHPLE